MMLLPDEGGTGFGLDQPRPTRAPMSPLARKPAAGRPPVPPQAPASVIMPIAGKVQSVPVPQSGGMDTNPQPAMNPTIGGGSNYSNLFGQVKAGGGMSVDPMSQQPSIAPPVSSIKPIAGKVMTRTANPDGSSPWSGGIPGASPVPPAPPPSSAPPGMPTSQFGPGNDLQSTQINPNNPVNRTQLAQNSIDSWEAQAAPRLAAEQRTIGQNAAKFGRIGAGMTTNDLTGAQATHDRDRMSFRNALASGLADDTVNDARSDNNELRTERGYQTGRNDKAQQDSIDQRVLEEDLLNSQFGRAQSRTRTGYGDSPVDTLGNFSDILGQSGAQSTGAGAELLGNSGGFGGLLKGIGGLFGGGPKIPQVDTDEILKGIKL